MFATYCAILTGNWHIRFLKHKLSMYVSQIRELGFYCVTRTIKGAATIAEKGLVLLR